MSRSSMTAALIERGFELSFDLRLRAIGRSKIMVIKEVRSLTRWGLRQSKDKVEARGLLLEAMPLAQAEAAHAKLVAAGASVELDLEGATLHAFDPADPKRSRQTMERLRVDSLRCILDRGRPGAWDVGEDRNFAELASLLGFIDAQRRRWAGAGWHEGEDELAVLVALSARDEAMEGRLLAAAEGEALTLEAAVHGDWLQAQGDPRGELAAASLAWAEAQGAEGAAQSVRREREGELEAVLDALSPLLFGPVPELRERAELEFMGGNLRGLHFTHGQGEPSPQTWAFLETCLRLPICAVLRALTLRDPTSTHPDLGPQLSAAPCAQSLRRLTIEAAARVVLDETFPRLEALSVDTRGLELGLRAPRLRSLELRVSAPSPDLHADLVGLEAPVLERFALSVDAHPYWDQQSGPLHDHLGRILGEPSFGRLRTLALASPPDSAPYGGGLAAVLATAPARASLERVDLRGAELDGGARRALEARAGDIPGLLLPP